jgi:peptide/nickel transport system substrate-binding protein
MKTETTRRLFGAAVMALALTIVTSGSFVRSAKSAEMIDEVTWALPDFPDVLFVPHAWSTNTGGIMSLVQEGLLAFDDSLALTTGVAESWEQVDDVTYTYRLRDGVTFHDGSPVTTEDVVYSMLWHLNPDSGSQLTPFYGSLDSIEATGEREITVKLKSPDVQFQYTPAHMSGFIMKKEQLAAHPDDYGTPDVLPIGTGPYKVVEFVPDERVVLEAHEGYWGTPPPAKRLTILSIPDQQTRLLAMRNGDIDGTFDVSISDIDQWKELDGVDVVTAPSLGVLLLTLDQKTPPLDNVHVRRAIAHSLDREGLVKALLKGNGAPAVALNPAEMWAGVLTLEEVKDFYGTLNPHEFDLAKAKAELEASGTGGFESTVSVPASDPYMVSILLTLAENLKPLGVTLKVQEVDETQWLDVYFAHENLGIQMMSYYPDYADPANYPFLFFASQNASKDGLNGSNYVNPKMDALLSDALQQSDPKVRAEALKQVFRMANEEVVVVPVFWPDSAMAIRSDYKLDGYSAFWYNIPWAIRGFGAK